MKQTKQLIPVGDTHIPSFITGSNSLNPIDPARILSGIFDLAKTWLEQPTKRYAIEKESAIALEQLRARSKEIKRYYKHAFKERKIVLKNLLQLLGDADKSQNEPFVQNYLEAILTIMQDNPLQDKPGFDQDPASGSLLEF